VSNIDVASWPVPVIEPSAGPLLTGDFDIDLGIGTEWFAHEAGQLARLARGAGSLAEIRAAGHAMRVRYLQAHVDRIHEELTADGALDLRLDQLAAGAADLVPGLVPTPAEIQAERGHGQRAKDGREARLGVLFWAMLRSATAGPRVVRAMSLPTDRAVRELPAFRDTGRADLGAATVERRGRIGQVTIWNPRFLNAEDDAVVEALETAVDLVLLDSRIGVGVLRGGAVSHPRYAGRRVFNAGINLTHLHQGLISFTEFMLRRELGYISKMYRGLADPQIEKPWIGVVDTFAIGGGAQILLALDFVLAEQDAYFSLPALREGIIPGAANLRLHRHTGPRMARQMIFADRRVAATDPDAAMLCDLVVPPAELDEAVRRVARMLDTPAVIPNRRVMRQAEEPVDVFREYLAQYSLEQAQRLYSADLIEKLERDWINRAR
jgi:thioesterase DpgC